MKKLIKIIFVTGLLLFGNLFLQATEVKLLNKTNNDYKVVMKTLDYLQIGKNDINIKVKHKEHIVHNADITLKIYQPNNQISNYKVSSITDKGSYLVSINLPKKVIINIYYQLVKKLV